METAIRWSQNATPDLQRFLHVDVVGKSLKICRVRGWSEHGVDYETVASHSKVPSFRAFDWSPTNESIVALGQSSGETTVVKIADGSQDRLSFPIRNQRHCNAIALSTQNLLAAGLDRVRNDFCLNIWDLQQRISGTTSALGGEKLAIEPLHKLASSEPITSIKFFPDNPQLLVAGVKGQFVRLYDLRESLTTGVLQFATRCVNNLAVDPRDENYFASCFPHSDPLICIWDRRAGNRSTSVPVSYLSAAQGDVVPEVSLEIKRPIDIPGTIWSLRFATTRRGCLGVLSSTGHFKTYSISLDYISDDERGERERKSGHGREDYYYPEKVHVHQVRDVRRAHYHPTEKCDEAERIVSFDFTTVGHKLNEPNILALTGIGRVEIFGLPTPPEPAIFSSTGFLYQGNGEWHPLIGTRGEGKTDPEAAKEDIKAAKRRSRPNGGHKREPKLTLEKGSKQISNLQKYERDFDVVFFERATSVTELLSLTAQQRTRCRLGYCFSAAKNRSVVQDSPRLQSFWTWMERASKIASSGDLIHDNLDLSYVGVHGIWMDDLGPSTHRTRVSGPSTLNVSKVTESLARHLNIPARKICSSARIDQRRLCLYVADLAWTAEELEAIVDRLVEEKQHTKAAAIAMFIDERKLAYQILHRRSSDQSHRMLAMAIAGASKRSLLSSPEENETENDWAETVGALAEELPDPYARSILTLVRTGHHDAVVEEEALPLKYRIGIALRWLPDYALTNYIATATKTAIAAGDLEGIILTGTGTAAAVELMGNYIRRFGDLQTAVLALSATVPRYIDEPELVRRLSNWRETYRNQMNSWGLKFERVKFDIGTQKLTVKISGERLMEPARPQVALTCVYCSQALAQLDRNTDQKETEWFTERMWRL